MSDPKDNIPLTFQQLKDLLAEARKPHIDPAEEAKKLSQRDRVHTSELRRRAAEKRRWEACVHLREDNTSCIAWMRNSDGIVRGVCQRCQCPFVPTHPDYERLIRIPTGASVSFA